MPKLKKLPRVSHPFNQNVMFKEHDLRMRSFNHNSLIQDQILPKDNPKVKDILENWEEDELQNEAIKLMKRFKEVKSALYHISYEKAWNEKLQKEHDRQIAIQEDRLHGKSVKKLSAEDRKLKRKTGKTKLELNDAFLEIVGEMGVKIKEKGTI